MLVDSTIDITYAVLEAMAAQFLAIIRLATHKSLNLSFAAPFCIYISNCSLNLFRRGIIVNLLVLWLELKLLIFIFIAVCITLVIIAVNSCLV